MTYEVPAFLVSPPLASDCIDPIIYKSVVISSGGLDTSWIVPTSSGQGMTFKTSDTALAGDYRIRTTAHFYDSTNPDSDAVFVEWDLKAMPVDCINESFTLSPDLTAQNPNAFMVVQVRPSKPVATKTI